MLDACATNRSFLRISSPERKSCLAGFEENTSLVNRQGSDRYQVSPPGSGIHGQLHIECQADVPTEPSAKQSFRTPIT